MPKISELTAGTALTGTEEIPAVQGGVTKQVTAAQIATYVGGAVSIASALEVDDTFLYETEASAFFARLATTPSDARKLLYNNLIITLKDASIWTKLDALWIFAAVNAATALTNLVSSSYGAAVAGAPAFAVDVGYTGNGVNTSINTGFNPTTGTQYVQNSASAFVWCNVNVAEDKGVLGVPTTTGAPALNQKLYIFPQWSDGFSYSNINSDGTATKLDPSAAGISKGLYHLSRTSSVLQTLFRSGTPLDTNANASIAGPNDTMHLLRVGTTFSTNQVLCGGVGAGMNAAEVVQLYNALHTYLQTVAGIA